MRYLIQSKWWQQWCDYSNFNQDVTTNFDDLSCKELNLTQMVMNEETTSSSVLYGRPDTIKNAELLLNEAAKSSCGKSGHLKPDLTLYFDYVTVTKEVWTHLYSWYSADYVIFRNL